MEAPTNREIFKEKLRKDGMSENVIHLLDTTGSNKGIGKKDDDKSESNAIKLNKNIYNTEVELTELNSKINQLESKKEYLKRGLEITLKENPLEKAKLDKISEAIKNLELEDKDITNRVEKLQIDSKKRRDEIKEQLSKNEYKDDEEAGIDFIKNLESDELMNKYVKAINELNARSQEIEIDRKFLERNIILAGILRGVKL